MSSTGRRVAGRGMALVTVLLAGFSACGPLSMDRWRGNEFTATVDS